MSAILVINCGSSSVKFSCIDTTTEALLLSGLAEKLGSNTAVLKITVPENARFDLGNGSHAEAIKLLFDQLDKFGLLDQIKAVGHRVVHGAEAFSASTIITPEVHAAIERCSPFAPLHNPANLIGINMVSELAPRLPQVAVFDTAFHQTLAAEAYLYAVPMAWYRNFGVRRYGFHGTSHRFVAQQAALLLGIPVSEACFITVHLGNGASAAAILNGRSVDTTMGFTPLEGLVMGTRSGDIDAGLLPYVAQSLNLSVEQVVDHLNKSSGLLGLSELSNDMRTLAEAAANGNTAAWLAISVFVFRLARAIGALAMSLPRLDALIFTGGIGENSALVRSQTLARLSILGFVTDEAANVAMVQGRSGCISSAESTTALVVKTNEELMIAQDTLQVISGTF